MGKGHPPGPFHVPGSGIEESLKFILKGFVIATAYIAKSRNLGRTHLRRLIHSWKGAKA